MKPDTDPPNAPESKSNANDSLRLPPLPEVQAPDGLSSDEARRLLERFGPNALPDTSVHPFRRAFEKFWAPVPWMLEAAILLELALGKYVEAAIIATLLVFNAALGLFQESRAQATLAALKSRLALNASVRRDGAWKTIQAVELVPGDVVKLSLGAVVAADVRLTGGEVLLDQSMLTGESVPIEAGAGVQSYAGALVRRGEAVAEVTATGTRTKFGRTAELVRIAHVVSSQQKAVLRVVSNLAAFNGVVILMLVAYVYAPERKSLNEATGMAGCAGVKIRHLSSPLLFLARAGDEAGGALFSGPACSPDRGIKRAGGGAAVWDRPENGLENVELLDPAWLSAVEAADQAEAGPVCCDHRPHSRRGQKPAQEAAAYVEADLRAVAGRAWLHRAHHDRKGLRGELAATLARDVCAAGASAGSRSGGFWRGPRHHRRRGAQDPLFRFPLAALGRQLRGGLCGGND